MSSIQTYLHNFAFNVYPYVCLAVFLMGSLARFDRDDRRLVEDDPAALDVDERVRRTEVDRHVR